MGKGDKIKEKPLILLFSQVSTFSIFFTFQVFLLLEGHMKQKNGGRGHGGGSFRSELGHIGHFNTYFSVNRPELTRIWKKKKKKKKGCMDTLSAASCTTHHVECECGDPRATPVLSRITFTDLVTVVKLCTIVGTFTPRSFKNISIIAKI